MSILRESYGRSHSVIFVVKTRGGKMEEKKRIEFEDGSYLVVPHAWIDCIRQKYGITWNEYWKQIKPKIDKLWNERKVFTKFGVEAFEYVFGACEPTRANHAEHCIYTDLRACLLAKVFEALSKEVGRKVRVVGIAEGKARVYEGDSVREIDSIDDI